MDYKLLDYYFKNELYLQYFPMKTIDFIKFCKERGIKINKNFLEELEKDRKFYPIFRINANYSLTLKDVEKNVNQYPQDFEYKYFGPSSGSPQFFLKSQNKKQQIYFPKDFDFVPYSEFKDTELDQYKVYSYYSAYQVYHLEKIINNELVNKNTLDKMVDLLISIQIYSPFGRSNMKQILVKDDYNIWRNHFNNFNINDIFQLLDISDDFLIYCYRNICGNLKRLLGSNDAIQLWKNVKWKEKDKCIGQTRLGIEYLHWAMMLKRCIEDYYKREIYDVDEVQYISAEKIKFVNPLEEKGFTLRGRRNKIFINEINGKYEFNLNRKKLFYLANKLTLDYQPRILIFVEGTTEEILIPMFFDEFYGNFEDTGFEIVNIKGIGSFFSGNLNPNRRHEKVIVSNFKNLISFNLNKWQTIPFFIGDDEGDIVDKLKDGEVFDLKDTFYLIYGISIKEYEHVFKYTFDTFWNLLLTCHDLNSEKNKKFASNFYNKTKSKNPMIDEWIHIWKQDFELDNFTPEELVEAINCECNLNISTDDINNLKSYNDSHDNKKSINKLVDDDTIKNNKIQINKKAFDILVENYHKNGEDYIKQRPIFEVIDKLFDLRYLNETSKNTVHSIKNLRNIYNNIFNK